MDKKVAKSRDDYPILMTPDHVREILGLGRRYTYEFLNMTEAKVLRNKNPEFYVFRVGKYLKINRDSFFNYIEGKK